MKLSFILSLALVLATSVHTQRTVTVSNACSYTIWYVRIEELPNQLIANTLTTRPAVAIHLTRFVSFIFNIVLVVHRVWYPSKLHHRVCVSFFYVFSGPRLNLFWRWEAAPGSSVTFQVRASDQFRFSLILMCEINDR